MRKNGFNLPLHPLQILLWLLILYQVTTNESSIIPALEYEKKIAYIFLYHLTLLIFIVAGFLATLINPTDEISKLGMIIQGKGILAMCRLCKSNVSKTSKHCAPCGRCVNSFDHHCKWLNNCVGARNYKHFLVSVIGFFLNSLFILIFSLYLLIEYSENKGKFEEVIKENESIKAWISQTIILFGYSVISTMLLGNLLFFHIWLKCKGLTTFEYVLSRRKKISLKIDNCHDTVSRELDGTSKIEDNQNFILPNITDNKP